MTLDEQTIQEIRSFVTEEVHRVVRREMAQWWTESIMALTGHPPPSQHGESAPGAGSDEREASSSESGAASLKKTIQPKKLGRTRWDPVQQLGQLQQAGQPGHGAAEGQGTDEAGDLASIVRIVESLLLSQQALVEQLNVSMRRIERLLEEDRP